MNVEAAWSFSSEPLSNAVPSECQPKGTRSSRRKKDIMAYKTKHNKIVPKRAKRKVCEITAADLPNMADALFEADHNDGRHGWVAMGANPKGRDCINALFPKAHIEWRDPGEGLPDDWLGFDINVPGVIAEIETKLPLEITRGADLDTANPDALAYLLAAGVNRQGARAAVWFDDDHLEIYVPPAGNN
jgi:hypothetical protein